MTFEDHERELKAALEALMARCEASKADGFEVSCSVLLGPFNVRRHAVLDISRNSTLLGDRHDRA